MSFLIFHGKEMENETIYLCLSDGMAYERLPTHYGSAVRREKPGTSVSLALNWDEWDFE